LYFWPYHPHSSRSPFCFWSFLFLSSFFSFISGDVTCVPRNNLPFTIYNCTSEWRLFYAFYLKVLDSHISPCRVVFPLPPLLLLFLLLLDESISTRMSTKRHLQLALSTLSFAVSSRFAPYMMHLLLLRDALKEK
jgi:hypothetical protein